MSSKACSSELRLLGLSSGCSERSRCQSDHAAEDEHETWARCETGWTALQAGLGQVLGEVGITAEHPPSSPDTAEHLLGPRWRRQELSTARWESGPESPHQAVARRS